MDANVWLPAITAVLAIVFFVLLQVFVAWGGCKNPGSKCPKCGSSNPVRLWST